MVIYSLAARLNQSIQSVMSMPEEEFYGWIAFFELTKPA
ncbi:hypothetical protein SAMN05216228_100216 [Rhizobium tibeticum]|uniref:Uncharacterized protein n=1 Tax=Rhizobium tibeticum TaxID=501024 RepID=A0A1H8DDA6_9HYPH|nr:hypothetical protein RTCCBAU85039_0837 [Rhizobium tibeticum]SEN05270.1 hypothetical protein SAMN05216228_100216 [Rhizobium tibeticum]